MDAPENQFPSHLEFIIYSYTVTGVPGTSSGLFYKKHQHQQKRARLSLFAKGLAQHSTAQYMKILI